MCTACALQRARSENLAPTPRAPAVGHERGRDGPPRAPRVPEACAPVGAGRGQRRLAHQRGRRDAAAGRPGGGGPARFGAQLPPAAPPRRVSGRRGCTACAEEAGGARLDELVARREAPVQGRPVNLGAERGAQLAHAGPEAESGGGSPRRARCTAAACSAAAGEPGALARRRGARAAPSYQRSRAWDEGARAGGPAQVQAAVGGARHELHAVRGRVQRADRRAVRLPGRLGGRQLARRGRRVVHRQARAVAGGAAARQRAAPAVQRHHLGGSGS